MAGTEMALCRGIGQGVAHMNIAGRRRGLGRCHAPKIQNYPNFDRINMTRSSALSS